MLVVGRLMGWSAPVRLPDWLEQVYLILIGAKRTGRTRHSLLLLRGVTGTRCDVVAHLLNVAVSVLLQNGIAQGFDQLQLFLQLPNNLSLILFYILLLNLINVFFSIKTGKMAKNHTFSWF